MKSSKTFRTFLFFGIFFTILQLHLVAQKSPEVMMSQNLKMSRSEFLNDHVISDSEGHIVVSRQGFLGARNSTISLKRFNKKLNLEKELELKADQKNIYYLNAMNIGNKVYVLSQEKDAKNDKLKYFLVPFDNSLKAGKPKKIAEFVFEKRSDEPEYMVNYSQDSSMTSFVFFLDNNSKKENFEMFVTVINKENEKVWDNKVRVNKFQNVIQLLSSSVNNEGNVYLIMKEYEGEKAKESKKVEKGDDKIDKPAYEMKIYKLNGLEENKKEIKIALKNSFIANCNIKVLPNGDMNVLGMYSSSKKLLVNGVFSIKLHGVTDSIYQSSKKDFTEQDLYVLSEEDVTKKNKGDEGIDSKFDFLDFHTRKDGSTTIVMEENYITVVATRSGNGAVTYTYYYHTNEAIVINLESSGEIRNIAILPKKQKFANVQYFNSSVVLFTDDGLHLVHLDDIDNFQKPYGEKVKRISSFKDCVAVDIFLKNDGTLERTLLMSREDTKAIILPKISKKISSNEIFFFAMNPNFFSSKDNRVGIIKY